MQRHTTGADAWLQALDECVGREVGGGRGDCTWRAKSDIYDCLIVYCCLFNLLSCLIGEQSLSYVSFTYNTDGRDLSLDSCIYTTNNSRETELDMEGRETVGRCCRLKCEELWRLFDTQVQK